MRTRVSLFGLVAAVVAVACPASAGLVGLSVGAYGGTSVSSLGDPDGGAVLGAKVRATLPGGFLAVEASYTRVSSEDAQSFWSDVSAETVLDGDGTELYSADVLLGGPGAPSPFRWFLVAGLNARDLSDLGGEGGVEPGGQAGIGIEIGAPVTGLSLELRGMLRWLDWSKPGDDGYATATCGLNYAF